jgi:hypothetical protein
MLLAIGLRVEHEDTRPLRPDATAFATRTSVDVASVSGEALARLASHGASTRDGPGDSGLFNDTLFRQGLAVGWARPPGGNIAPVFEAQAVPSRPEASTGFGGHQPWLR